MLPVERQEQNRVREMMGLCPLAPPKDFRIPPKRIFLLAMTREYAWGGWTLDHNKRKRKGQRKR